MKILNSDAFYLTLTNFFQFISIFSPLIVLFIISIYSIFTNNTIKLIFLFIGTIITTLISFVFKGILNEKQDKRALMTCNYLPPPFSHINKNNEILTSPSSSIALLSFFLMYMIYPMYNNNNYNYKLLIFILIIFSLNLLVEIFNFCSSAMGSILGMLLGITIGLFYFLILTNFESDYFKLTYFSNTVINNKRCHLTITNKYLCK